MISKTETPPQMGERVLESAIYRDFWSNAKNEMVSSCSRLDLTVILLKSKGLDKIF